MSLLVVLSEPKSASVTIHNSTFDGADSTTYTFSSQPIGEKTATKVVVAGIAHHTLTSAEISSVSVGGVAATLVTNVTDGTGNIKSSLWQASVSSSSSVDVTVDLNATAIRCGLALWSLHGASSISLDTATYGTAASTSASVGIDVPDGGALIALHDGAATNTTWTNVSSTGDFNQPLEGTPFSGASKSFSGTQTNLLIRAEDGVSSNRTMVVASWGPF